MNSHLEPTAMPSSLVIEGHVTIRRMFKVRSTIDASSGRTLAFWRTAIVLSAQPRKCGQSFSVKKSVCMTQSTAKPRGDLRPLIAIRKGGGETTDVFDGGSSSLEMILLDSATICQLFNSSPYTLQDPSCSTSRMEKSGGC